MPGSFRVEQGPGGTKSEEVHEGPTGKGVFPLSRSLITLHRAGPKFGPILLEEISQPIPGEIDLVTGEVSGFRALQKPKEDAAHEAALQWSPWNIRRLAHGEEERLGEEIVRRSRLAGFIQGPRFGKERTGKASGNPCPPKASCGTIHTHGPQASHELGIPGLASQTQAIRSEALWM